MDDQEQAHQALVKMFRRDEAQPKAPLPPEPRWGHGPGLQMWIAAIAIIVLIAGPLAFIVIYPRFGPVDTMTAFCQDESSGDYATAYTLLSQREQQHISLAEFTKASNAANLGDCQPSGGIPLILGGSQASLNVVFTTADPNGDAVTSNGTMSFTNESGGWRVDSMAPDLLDLSS